MAAKTKAVKSSKDELSRDALAFVLLLAENWVLTGHVPAHTGQAAYDLLSRHGLELRPRFGDDDDRAIVDAAAIRARGGNYRFVGVVRDGLLAGIRCEEVG